VLILKQILSWTIFGLEFLNVAVDFELDIVFNYFLDYYFANFHNI
jgi:hypothetical protein